MVTATRSTFISKVGMEENVSRLQELIEEWIARSDGEMQEMLRWQFTGPSKFFRPVTIFSCYHAAIGGPIPPHVMHSAVVLEMFHNVSLIIDDILDKSRYRRNKLTLHCRFGLLPSLMASGYIVAEGFNMVRDDPLSVDLLSELLKRLGVAECVQWRLRRHPLNVEEWRMIAGEDTGSMFEVCACLGTRDDTLRKYGGLLGLLYHGCDDVGDVRGAAALGGGGDEDIRDGILTLPAAIAIKDPHAAMLFRNPSEQNRRELAIIMDSKLSEAEGYLDSVAKEANAEALLHASQPEPLFALVRETRKLSRT
jgi:geranylgeranyl pyrophosphate synthase